MNDPDLPELPDDVTALLDEARGVPRAPDAARRRVAARLALTAGMAIPAASLAGARAVGHAWFAKAVGVAAFVALAGGAARLAARRPAAPPPAATARVAPRPPPAAPAAVVVAPAPVAAPPAVVAPAPVARPATAAPRDDDRAFRDELALLDRALAALGHDDVGGAAAALSQHARRFPAGRLAPEREALRVRCAAAGGDPAAAEAARRRFHQRYPDSVLGAAVDRSVEGVAPRP